MNDLLGDSAAADGREVDLEAGPFDVPDAGQNMSLFFQEVNDIKSSMAEIRKKFQKLQDTNDESKNVTKAPTMKALKEKMEQDLDDISKIAQGLKRKLEALDRANVANRKIKGCHEGSSTDRTRITISSTLKKKLKELMIGFQALRQRFQDEHREVVERRVFTVTGQKVDESVIERLIETGDSEQIFQRAIQEQGRGQILDTIAELQERHDAVREIEKKLLELHQIFIDMAVLVESQGELLDSIETQVSKAVEHVAAGTSALQKAKTLQRGTRKCTCVAIFLLLVTAIIVLLAVIQPWKINATK
ncbi:syntaxin-132 isoform X1 [Physcomitrium patens]|uniref:t-SNARE coiled-coil homology domain-containing protein n=3 Tax=Physcomitrium patens TaxID=3218 RepID=A0A2K1KQP7_PHYPA|nr:syntaxin-132-like isoform X1 [Physcomitrium patens]PNR56123.1 hypothetical protein PHYPA_007020 [Physcomitrium patens]|eukprot:XP_024372822.1 syntaxin-132-like isoform X1 [Physcomitrella patens]